VQKTFDPDYGSALDAGAAIRAKTISSVELTKHTLRRINAFQPRLNAWVYQLREEALAAAREADESLARNEATGVFHGVPINVKESFGVEGQPCTWGIPGLKRSRAPLHATAVRRLLNAGAILLGATNVPLYLMDSQAFNDIYGTSNNPWDLSRTPGGSSGGSAASLAAGMTFLSIGSDIGGSIRSPASFCGIYGHKPTLDIVPLTGHAPGGLRGSPGFSILLAVAGPVRVTEAFAITGLDLSLKIRRCPCPRKPGPFRRAGATLKQEWPSDFSLGELLDTYFSHLGAFDFSMTPPESRELVREHRRIPARSNPCRPPE
jgi:hypothetical protein